MRYSQAEIEIMAEGGRLLARVIAELKGAVRPGVVTRSLDDLCREKIRSLGAEPAFLNYRPPGGRKPYPFSLCVSLNDVVVHGRPSARVVKDGDLVKLDAGLKYKGFYVDSAVTVGAGETSREARKLMETTSLALKKGVAEAKIGKAVGDIGYAVERCARKAKFSVVRVLVGHGVGRKLHEEPTVPNFGSRGEGVKLEVGMVLAIEPMIAAGSGEVKELADESFATSDGSLSAHFEHTVAITERGPLVLT